MKHFVFIYGSLRRGCAGAMSVRFPKSKFVGEAKVSGKLYDLGDYPGLLTNEAVASQVVGEVYELDAELLDQLDDFEVSNNYVRKPVEILLPDGPRLCWVYEPDPDFYSLTTLIASGDWVQYARKKNRSDG
jgi:gamma-glutamylcyclotransferase (GGCT)/AIG2-like uncharacterized protein YtfP